MGRARMRVLILLAAVCTAAMVVPVQAGAPLASGAASPHFRLEWFSPTGGETEMASPGYRLRATVSPPLSGVMGSEHFGIRPLLQTPDTGPAEFRVIVLQAARRREFL